MNTPTSLNVNKIFILFLSFLLISSLAFGETIQLKTGKTFEGKIVGKTDKYIKVDIGIGMPITYFLDDIASINDKAVGSKNNITPTAQSSKELKTFSITPKLNEGTIGSPAAPQPTKPKDDSFLGLKPDEITKNLGPETIQLYTEKGAAGLFNDRNFRDNFINTLTGNLGLRPAGTAPPLPR